MKIPKYKIGDHLLGVSGNEEFGGIVTDIDQDIDPVYKINGKWYLEREVLNKKDK